jgi:hypothetical protein
VAQLLFGGLQRARALGDALLELFLGALERFDRQLALRDVERNPDQMSGAT